MYVGIPYAPISPAYALISNDFSKLRYIFDLLTPGLVFATDGAPYRRAIETVVPPNVEVIVARNPIPGRPTRCSRPVAPTSTASADAAPPRSVPPIVKFLFTSPTGTPRR
jgi:feruloyl-CoA synthase